LEQHKKNLVKCPLFLAGGRRFVKRAGMMMIMKNEKWMFVHCW
jgi:hypothetical protein